MNCGGDLSEFTNFTETETRLNAQFREHRHVPDWEGHVYAEAEAIPDRAERARIRRTKSNYRGIGAHRDLSDLIAGAVDQPFLEEIGNLRGLERLELEWPVTATDLTPLLGLDRLRHLAIDSPRKIADFTPLLQLPALTTLLITNAKQMADLEWLRGAHRIEVLGVEGGMWSPQKIPSLEPLAGLESLRALFATTIRLGDKNLMPLAQCPKLEYIGMAAAAPRKEFERLHAARPDIVCQWFRPEPWAMIANARASSRR